MKRAVTVLFSMLCILCLSGCVRFSTTVKVKPNGKADVALLYAIGVDMNELSQAIGEEPDTPTEMLDDMEKNGWESEAYNEDGFSGYKFIKRDVNFNEIGDSLKGGEGGSDYALVSGDELLVQRKGTKYTVDWFLMDSEEMSSMAAFKNYFNMSGGYMNIVLELPHKPTAHNAHTVSDDGKTLTWDLMELQPGENIHVEFDLINWPLIIGIIIGLVILLVIIIVVIVILLNGNKKKPAQGAGNPYQGYGAPMQGYGQPQNFGGMPGQGYGQPQNFGGMPGQGYGQPQTPGGMTGQSYGQPTENLGELSGQAQAPVMPPVQPQVPPQAPVAPQNPAWGQPQVPPQNFGQPQTPPPDFGKTEEPVPPQAPVQPQAPVMPQVPPVQPQVPPQPQPPVPPQVPPKAPAQQFGYVEMEIPEWARRAAQAPPESQNPYYKK